MFKIWNEHSSKSGVLNRWGITPIGVMRQFLWGNEEVLEIVKFFSVFSVNSKNQNFIIKCKNFCAPRNSFNFKIIFYL